MFSQSAAAEASIVNWAAKHAIGAVVAVCLVAVACVEGGYARGATAGVALLVWWAIALGLAAGALPRSPLPRAAAVTAGAALALAAFTGLSIWWATDDGAAFDEMVRALALLGVLLGCLAVARPGDASGWLGGLGAGIAAIALIALMARLLPGLGADDRLVALLPETAGRASFPIGYWNALAALVAGAIPLLAHEAAAGRRRIRTAGAAAGLPLLGLTLYFTFSRGGVIAAVAGAVTLLVVGPRRRRSAAVLAVGGAASGILIMLARSFGDLSSGFDSSTAQTQGLVLIAALALASVLAGAASARAAEAAERLRMPRPSKRVLLAAVAAVAVLVAILIDPAARVEELKEPPPAVFAPREDASSGRLLDGTGNGRYQFWEAAVEAFEHRPVWGIGAGAYSAWFARYGTIYYPVRDAHSLPLETLAELGLLGACLLLGAAGFVAFTALRRLRDPAAPPEIPPLLGLLVASAVAVSVDWSWEIPAVAFPAVIAAAVLVGPSTAGPTAPPPRSRTTRIQLAGLLIASAAIWAAGTSFLYSSRLEASRAAAASGRFADAAASAAAAIEFEPWAAGARTQLALAQEARGDLIDALLTIREATDRAPFDGSLWFLRARIALRAGSYEEAVNSLEQARALRPRDPLFGIAG